MSRPIKLTLIAIFLGITALASTRPTAISTSFAALTNFSRPLIDLIPDDSLELSGDSPDLFASAPHLTQEFLPLTGLARRKANLPSVEIEAFALLFCATWWLTARDTAALLGRKAEYLQGRNHIELVKVGLLALRFLIVPNSLDQDYRVTFAEKGVPATCICS